MERAGGAKTALRGLACFRLVVGVGAVGFCLDNRPSLLEGTGFAGSPSRYPSELDCRAAGHAWCPLSNETDTWDADGATVEYYWFSACCLGRQAAGVVPDPSDGLPTCERGRPREECTTTHWTQKLKNDLVSADSGYDFTVLPSTVFRPGLHAPGWRGSSAGAEQQQPSCYCSPDDARCEKRTADGTLCLVCRTRDKCSDDAVSVGIHFFKLHTVDLKTSLLTFAAWLRESWRDPRLKYNAQCYGGLDSFEVVAQSGSLENSVIWTPDLELYNGEDSIWQGSIQAHLAQVYPCTSSGKPARGTCGSIFWSRPGLLKALCKYEGLLSFPLDHLHCKLEVAGFIVDGRRQDIVLRAIDDGVSWSGKGTASGFAGLTSGSSFQDYRIASIESERYVVYYDCCPNSPYPTLVFSINFQRSSAYYVLRLILPAIFLASTSFVTFWMNPEIGERLGFCITVILAMFTNDVVSAELMPIANEKLMMDYLSLGCTLFGMFSLFETGIVLFLYHNCAESWKACLVPATVREFLDRPHSCRTLFKEKLFKPDVVAGHRSDTVAWASSTDGCKSPIISENSETKDEKRRFSDILSMLEKPESKDSKIRRQLYRQIFFTIDKDFSGSLSRAEVSEFARFMFGDSWNSSKASDFITSLDTNGDGSLGFNEFTAFCDAFLPYVDDLKYMKAMLDGFLQVVERKRLARQRMWQERAKHIDQFCRWSVPPGFVLYLAVLFTRSEIDFSLMIDSFERQFLLVFTGFFALVIATTAYGLHKLHSYWLHRHAKYSKHKRSSGSCVEEHSPRGCGVVPDAFSAQVSESRGGRDPCSGSSSPSSGNSCYVGEEGSRAPPLLPGAATTQNLT